MMKAIAAGIIVGIGLLASGAVAHAQVLQPRTLDDMCAAGSPASAIPSLACFGAGYRLTLERAGREDLAR